MSFNHHLNFNISKATPTTSTSNTNTISDSISIGHSESPSSLDGSTTSSSVKSPPYLQSILMKSNRDTLNNPTASPPLAPQPQSQSQLTSSTTHQALTSSPKLTASSAVPAILTINNSDHTSSNTTAKNSSNSSKTDLIGLFDKFDINKDDKDQTRKQEENEQAGELSSEKHVDVDDDTDHEHKLEKMNLEEDIEKEEKQHSSKEEVIITTESVHLEKGSLRLDKDTNHEQSSPKETIEKNNGTASIAALMTIQPYIPPEEEEKPEAQAKSSTTQFNDNLIDLGDTFSKETLEKQKPIEIITEKPVESTVQDNIDKHASPRNVIQGDISDIEGKGEENLPVEEFEVKVTTPVPEPPQERSTNEQEQPVANKPHKHRFQINDSEEQNKQSHKPFDFQNFLSQLRKKSADPIVRYIRSFLSSFIKLGHTFTADQRMKIIKDFKNFMNEKFALYEPFASMDQIDLENSREGLEKLIMNRLHDLCFPPEVVKQNLPYIPEVYTRDLEKDELFSLQLEKFSWINGSHLDIDMNDLANTIVKNNQSFLDYAITELNKINNYRAPRDKIICILNSCKIIFSYLKLRRQETNADAFIPILILVIFKAKTENLVSNIHYIENFRGDEWLSHGETSYYLSSIQGAISFIENLTAEDLTISPEEFDAHMEAWEAQKKQRDRQLKLQQPIPTTPTAQTFSHSPTKQQHQALSPSNDLFPSSVLLSSAEMVTKSITNFLSPLPQPQDSEPEEFQPPPNPPPVQENDGSAQYQPLSPREEEIDSEQMKQAYDTLKEIFPTLDTNILKDIIFINRGNVDVCIDSCLQLVDG